MNTYLGVERGHADFTEGCLLLLRSGRCTLVELSLSCQYFFDGHWSLDLLPGDNPASLPPPPLKRLESASLYAEARAWADSG